MSTLEHTIRKIHEAIGVGGTDKPSGPQGGFHGSFSSRKKSSNVNAVRNTAQQRHAAPIASFESGGKTTKNPVPNIGDREDSADLSARGAPQESGKVPYKSMRTKLKEITEQEDQKKKKLNNDDKKITTSDSSLLQPFKSLYHSVMGGSQAAVPPKATSSTPSQETTKVEPPKEEKPKPKIIGKLPDNPDDLLKAGTVAKPKDTASKEEKSEQEKELPKDAAGTPSAAGVKGSPGSPSGEVPPERAWNAFIQQKRREFEDFAQHMHGPGYWSDPKNFGGKKPPGPIMFGSQPSAVDSGIEGAVTKGKQDAAKDIGKEITDTLAGTTMGDAVKKYGPIAGLAAAMYASQKLSSLFGGGAGGGAGAPVSQLVHAAGTIPAHQSQVSGFTWSPLGGYGGRSPGGAGAGILGAGAGGGVNKSQILGRMRNLLGATKQARTAGEEESTNEETMQEEKSCPNTEKRRKVEYIDRKEMKKDRYTSRSNMGRNSAVKTRIIDEETRRMNIIREAIRDKQKEKKKMSVGQDKTPIDIHPELKQPPIGTMGT